MKYIIFIILFSIFFLLTNTYGKDRDQPIQDSTMLKNSAKNISKKTNEKTISNIKISGETWSKGVYKGNPLIITWDSQSTDNVNIYLEQSNDSWEIALEIKNTGRYEWTVGSEIPKNVENYSKPPYQQLKNSPYFIRVVLSGGTGQADSKPFKISLGDPKNPDLKNTKNLLKLSVNCQKSDACFFVGSGIPLEFKLTNISKSTIGFPLEFFKTYGPLIQYKPFNSTKKKETSLYLKLHEDEEIKYWGPDMPAVKFIQLKPSESISLTWKIGMEDLNLASSGTADFEVNVSIKGYVQIDGAYVKPICSHTFRLIHPSLAHRLTMKTYRLNKNQSTTVNGLLIKNLGVLSGVTKGGERHLTSIKLWIQPRGKKGQEYTASIQLMSAEEQNKFPEDQQKSNAIITHGHEITLRDADGFKGQEIEFTVEKIKN